MLAATASVASIETTSSRQDRSKRVSHAGHSMPSSYLQSFQFDDVKTSLNEIYGAMSLLESTPLFTTPSADFPLHSKELETLVDEVYRLRDYYFCMFPPQELLELQHIIQVCHPPNSSEKSSVAPSEWLQIKTLDKSSIAEQRVLYLESLISRVLDRFNMLTKPQVKKKKKKKQANNSQQKVDEELHNSTLSLKNTLSVTAPRASNESLPSHRYSTVPIQQPFSTFNLPLSDHMFDPTLTNSQKAFYYYLRGHLYNVLPFYSALAEENLAQAIKKNPTLIEAWNSLGECYWKKGDVIAAKDCFEGAIAYESLRKLSMVYRQLGTNGAERARYVEDSLTLCKEAVGMDLKDGVSWLILGNSYLKRFFNVSQDAKDIRMALHAYNQAEQDPVVQCDPDVYHNRAIVYDYLENYQNAFMGFLQALRLGPSEVGLEEKITETFYYVKKMHDFISKKGHVKNKRLQQELKSFRSLLDASVLQKASPIAYSDLQANQVHFGKVLICKILAPVLTRSGSYLRQSFVAVSQTGDVFGLTVYKLGQEADVLKPFDQVGILSPEFLQVQLRYNSVRVTDPGTLVVNGHALPRSSIAPVWLTTTVIS